MERGHYNYSFGRAHLGFQYQLSQNWLAKIIIDRGRATSVGTITVSDSSGNQMQVQNASSEGAYYTMFLKFASLQWKVNDKLALEGGAVLQNHYITQERFWGFRYVAQTFQDLYWKIPSSDLGFIAYYKINEWLAVDAALTNGEGPRLSQDAYGKVKFGGGIDMHPSQKVQTRLYFHKRQSGHAPSATEHLFSAFVGHKLSNKLRIGGEFNYMDNLNNALGMDSYGFSIYSACQIVERIQLFVRYDRLIYDVDRNANNSIKGNGNTLMGGLSYSPVKDVSLSLNYQGWLSDDENRNHENNILFSMEYKL
ncbi:MAG: hypothetical protein LC643_06405 [Bacteroidales bacterium]|nr:hypothetical protein [Bacteroidales bacterium]